MVHTNLKTATVLFVGPVTPRQKTYLYEFHNGRQAGYKHNYLKNCLGHLAIQDD